MCHEADRPLECQPSAVPESRRFVASQLRQWGVVAGDPAHLVVDDVLLVVSELVTNAIKSCHRRVHLSVRAHYDYIEIVVADDDPLPAVARHAVSSDQGGRGLAIVDAICRQWGQRRYDSEMKEVWGEVPIPSGSALRDGCSLAGS